MKKKQFYSVWAKTLIIILLLVAGGVSAICAGWSLIGASAGMTVKEIMNPVSYVDSQDMVQYVENEVSDQLELFKAESGILCGNDYNGDLTVDISNLSAGVNAEGKNQNLEYKLSDLENFYNSDGYALLLWLTENKYNYAYGDVWIEDADEEESAANDSSDVETSEANTTGESTTGVEEDVPQPIDTETEDLTDWFSENYDDSWLDGRDMGYYESYQVKCYSNETEVLYGNGIDIEQQYIKNINGGTLAESARTSGKMNRLLSWYEDLLDAAQQVHELVTKLQNPDKQYSNTNVYVYLVNTESGDIYTNVPAWKTGEQIFLSKLEQIYLTKDYSAEGSDVYVSIDTENNKTYASSDYDYMADDIKAMVQGTMENEKWNIFVGLDTNYHCKSSPSYYKSIIYTFYKDVSEQLTFNFGKEVQINVFVTMWIFIVIAVFLLILLALQTGRRPQDDEIHPVPMDKFPIEILLIKDIALWSLLMIVFSENIQWDLKYSYSMLPTVAKNSMVACTVCGMLATILMAWDVKSYGRRIKERTIGGSIIAGICHAIRKTVDASRKTIQDSYRAQKANKQLLVAYIVLLGVQTLFMLIICFLGFLVAPGGAIFFLILMLLFDLFVYLKMLRTTSGKEAIKDGIQQLAAGNLDYRINTEHMSGENLELAEEINKVRDGVEKAVEAEMKSERLKTDLITNVSHDIKTPLTSIINYVDILKRENIQDERIAGYIEILNRKALRLKQLTEDLVEASKISSGNIILNMQEINLKQLIKQTNGEFEEKFEAKKLDLICDLPEEQMLIMADGRRMFRVIENLYNNAAKYAMPGTRIYVNGSIEGDTVIFSMKNVSESPLNFKADELLERFVRGDVSRSSEGSGLGLEIARNLTVMQKGTFDLYLDGDLFKVTITFQKINKEEQNPKTEQTEV